MQYFADGDCRCCDSGSNDLSSNSGIDVFKLTETSDNDEADPRLTRNHSQIDNSDLKDIMDDATDILSDLDEVMDSDYPAMLQAIKLDAATRFSESG